MKKSAKGWFAASVILYARLKSGRQRKFYVWENVYLIAARDAEEALLRAEERGRQDAVPDETMTWGGKPAEWVFGGVRKLLTCSADLQTPVRRLHDGVEATFSTFTVNSKAELEALIQGKSVTVTYVED